MDIYIKPTIKCSIASKESIYIRDIAEVVAEENVAAKVKSLKILRIPKQKDSSFLISITDIIRIIQKEYPNATINNVGAEDTWIDYKVAQSEKAAAVRFLKVVFIGIILFAGAATAIMGFYTDSQTSKIFEQVYYMVYGTRNANPLIIEIPYAFGLAFGIIAFFNHFAGKKITDDPTPIEVEMSLYESDVTETMIDVLNAKRTKEGN